MKAVYLGTFDPLTFGHWDIILRASMIFSEVVVGIHMDSQKKTYFNDQQRLRMLEEACHSLPNVTVQLFSNLAVEFARSVSAKAFVRGLRSGSDLSLEMQMAGMNYHLQPKIETVFFPAKQSLTHISSSLVKEVAALGADISQLVPENVATLLGSAPSKNNQ